jgi:hypothetical protein
MRHDDQVNVVGHDLKRHDAPAVLASLGADQFLAPGADGISQHPAAVLRTPHNVIPQVIDATRRNLHFPCHHIKYPGAACLTGSSAIHPSPEGDSPLARI